MAAFCHHCISHSVTNVEGQALATPLAVEMGQTELQVWGRSSGIGLASARVWRLPSMTCSDQWWPTISLGSSFWINAHTNNGLKFDGFQFSCFYFFFNQKEVKISLKKCHHKHFLRPSMSSNRRIQWRHIKILWTQQQCRRWLWYLLDTQKDLFHLYFWVLLYEKYCLQL